MLEKFCDILVIGDELPGLITAAFLARRGLSVQVIDSDLFTGHPKLADPICLTNIHSKLLRSILGRLNVPEITIQNLVNQESSLQIIFPQNRIDILNNPLIYFEEIEREFKNSYTEIKSFYEHQARLRHKTDVTELFQQLIPATWKEKRAFKNFIKEQGLNDKSDEFEFLVRDKCLDYYFKCQLLLSYQNFVDFPFAYQVSEVFNPGDGEIFGIHAGIRKLKNILWERIRHYDGVIRKKVPINSLLYRNGVCEGVSLDETNGDILSKYVIWNTDLKKLQSFLPNKWRFRKLKRACQNFDQEFCWFSVKYHVEKKYIPELMKSNVLHVSNFDKDLTGDNLLYIQIDRDKIDTQASIFVHFLLPKAALKEEDAYFDHYFGAIRKQLLDILPFSDSSLIQDFPMKADYSESKTLFPLNENDYEIFKYSAEKHRVGIQHKKNFYDLFKFHYKTPAPNLYISHPSIFSAFGLESNIILGLKITDLIWQEVEKVKKRAMKSERRIA